MIQLQFSGEQPGLLVSVRNAAEAITALAGGADVIDVKEPNRGPLGAADAETVSAVVRAVNGRAPVTGAMGELLDMTITQYGDRAPAVPNGVSLYKIGLSGCVLQNDWRARWQRAIEAIASSSDHADARPVAVVYADWLTAQSPPPRDVLTAAVEHRCTTLLIDTWNKSAGSLFDHWPAEDLQNFLVTARSQSIAVVLAGSLTIDNIAAAAHLMPALFAVRAAACDDGRDGTVSVQRVRDLKRVITTAIRSAARTRTS